MSDDFGIPAGLSDRGDRAARVIRNFALEIGEDDPGGCRAFYSPAEWAGREEDYGTDSLLVVCHDGGCLTGMVPFGSARYDDLAARLTAEGLYLEQCTSWYSAVYEG